MKNKKEIIKPNIGSEEEKIHKRNNSGEIKKTLIKAGEELEGVLKNKELGEKNIAKTLLSDEYYTRLLDHVQKSKLPKKYESFLDKNFTNFRFYKNSSDNYKSEVGSENVVAIKTYNSYGMDCNRYDLYVKTPEALEELFNELVMLGYEINERYSADDGRNDGDFMRKNAGHTWSASLPRKENKVTFNGEEYEDGLSTNTPVPLSFNRIYEKRHGDSEYMHSNGDFDISKAIVSASNMNSDPGYYYQDGRKAFSDVHVQCMTTYVKNFTDYDINEWNLAIRSADKSGPGMISAIRDFCRRQNQKKNGKD